ncbi:MAG TPA: hypothetical protein VM406_16165 [Noviherbaspirillum sp.]|nr:hypothetical protein [Noviherbaspirillum sp.]
MKTASLAVALSAAALCAWGTWDQLATRHEPVRLLARPATGLAPVPAVGAAALPHVGEGSLVLFERDASGALRIGRHTRERLEELARSLPYDLSHAEWQAIDEFAAAGLDEPAASQARRIVREHLAARQAPSPGRAAPATAHPEPMTESLLALRPTPPPEQAVMRFPGMGDE